MEKDSRSNPTSEAVPPRRVAVIAVHGVANQQPGATARRIARLVAGPRGDRPSPYQAPTEVPMQISVAKPPDVTPPAEAQRISQGTDPDDAGDDLLDFVQPTVRAAVDGKYDHHPVRSRPHPRAPSPQTSREDLLVHNIFRSQLAQIELPVGDRVWETLRLETRDHERKCELHIHEMYWADLSRLGNSLLSPLLGLYQLLFFLPVLGQRTLAFAQACMPEKKRRGLLWRAWIQAHEFASVSLAVVVPILTLSVLDLMVVVTALHLLSEGDWLPLVPGVALVAAVTALSYRRRQLKLPDRWSWRIATPLILAALVLLVWRRFGDQPELRPIWWTLAVITLCLACWLANHLLLAIYDARLPGSRLLGDLVIGIGLIGLSALAWAHPELDEFTARLTEISSTGLIVGYWGFWLTFAVFAIASIGLGGLVVRRAGDDRERLRRASWTAHLSLLLTVPAVLLTNLSFWAVVIWASEHFLTRQEGAVASGFHVFEPAQIESWRETLVLSVPPFFAVWLVAVLLALISSLWATWPAIRADVHRRRGDAEVLNRSNWVGRSLSDGFTGTRRAVRLIQGLILAALPVGAAYMLYGWATTRRWPTQFLPPLLLLLLAVGFAAAILGRGPLAFLAFGFRSGLDIAFDVVNWLRSDPPSQTPSGRILCRYFSLLRHLESWRHPQDGGPYDAIIIVAHSQGAVIAADGLRFRHRNTQDRRDGDSAAPTRPIHLLTMGAPLHQLYGLRFPYRYGWAWSDKPWQEAEANAPEALGVAGWTNLYHSGDYVGRFLWHPQSDAKTDAPYDTEVTRRDGLRTERCLGAGGHNTYWDGHSPGVTEGLDELIAEACRGVDVS